MAWKVCNKFAQLFTLRHQQDTHILLSYCSGFVRFAFPHQYFRLKLAFSFILYFPGTLGYLRYCVLKILDGRHPQPIPGRKMWLQVFRCCRSSVFVCSNSTHPTQSASPHTPLSQPHNTHTSLTQPHTHPIVVAIHTPLSHLHISSQSREFDKKEKKSQPCQSAATHHTARRKPQQASQPDPTTHTTLPHYHTTLYYIL